MSSGGLGRRRPDGYSRTARLIYRLRSRDHITDALISLHWLRVPQRIQYKLLVLTYTRSYMEALHLVSVHSSASVIYLVDERCVLLFPNVLLCKQSNCLRSAVEPSRSPLPDPGTAIA